MASSFFSKIIVGIIGLVLMAVPVILFLLIRSRRAVCIAFDAARQENIVLAESAEKFKELFNMAPYGCAVNDLQGRFLMVNREFCRRLNIREEDVIGHTGFEMGFFSDAEAWEEAKEEIERTGEITGREVIVGSALGPAHAIYSGRMVEFAGERVVMTTTVDITDRRRAEEALQASEESFNRLFHSAPIPMAFAFDVGGYRATTWNESWYRTFGYSREEADGRSGLDIGLWVDPEDRRRFLTSVLQQNVVTRLEVPLRCKDGSFRNCEVYGRFIGKPGHQILVAAYHDVTERMRAEEERQTLQSQLAQSQKLESIGQLAGGVAHDYNNMLGVILGHVELALLKAGSEHPLAIHLREIQKSAKRSAELTQQLLAFARRQTIAPVVQDLNTAVADTLQMLCWLIGENIELKWHPGKGSFPVKIDPSQLDQMMVNLCVNARDAISGAGQITIETEMISLNAAQCAASSFMKPGDYVLLTVGDNGCGIDKETKAKIFEPFFTTKALGQGTGLGLATVYGIVKQNNGYINVESEPGQGTLFQIYLPQCDGAEKVTRAVDEPRGVAGNGEILLVVEDEAALLAINTTMLEDLGYRVLSAGTPTEAIRLAEANPGEIDLLMTDVVMPEMNGRELERRIRLVNPDIRCLFMSGYTSDVISHHGVLEEGVSFIQKPFAMKNLAVKVSEALGKKEQ